MELFSDEYIESYRPLFDNIKVIREAEKIFDAVKLADELSNDEKMASVVLSYLKFKDYYGGQQ